MNNAPLPLDQGLPALLQTLLRNNTLPHDFAKIIDALAGCGHTFAPYEIDTVLNFAIHCAYVESKDGILSLTQLGRERVLGRERHKAAPPAENPPPASAEPLPTFGGV